MTQQAETLDPALDEKAQREADIAALTAEAAFAQQRIADELAAKLGGLLDDQPVPKFAEFTSVRALLQAFGPERKAVDAFAAKIPELAATLQRQYVDRWLGMMGAGDTPDLMAFADAVKKHI